MDWQCSRERIVDVEIRAYLLPKFGRNASRQPDDHSHGVDPLVVTRVRRLGLDSELELGI